MGGLVSVIVPTYNRAEMVQRAVRSLLAQTYQDLEIIVVDDGSADATESVITAIDDGRVRYLRQDNRGAAAARNFGMDAASGNYIGFLDSDDEYLPTKVARQVEFLAAAPPGVVAVECGTIENANGAIRAVPSGLRGRGRPGLLAFATTSGLTPTFLYRAAAIDDLRWDESLPAYNEHDLLIRVTERGEVLWDDEPLVVVNLYTAGRMTHPARHVEAILKMYDKYRAELDATPELAARWHFKLGRLYAITGTYREAGKHFAAAADAVPAGRYRMLAAAGRGRGLPLMVAWPLYTKVSQVKRQRGSA